MGGLGRSALEAERPGTTDVLDNRLFSPFAV